MWALEDFTEEIGATRVVPGSHLWGKYRVAQRGEDIPAGMPRGSVVLYLGGTHTRNLNLSLPVTYMCGSILLTGGLRLQARGTDQVREVYF